MALDPQRIRFLGKAIGAAHRLGGSVEGDAAEAYVSALYQEWLGTGLALDQAPSWLAARMVNDFGHTSEPPTWVEEEPSWPFFEGKPMVFVSQASAGALAPGTVAYLFGARTPYKSGFKVIYHVVTQIEES
jgi:hypothetical protein